MASKMRRVRKRLREEMLRSVSSGDGNVETLTGIAGRLLGREVGYETVLKTFLANEVSNGLAQLRSEGLVESTGKQWKSTGSLEPEDVDVISLRRLKRLRGELQSEIRLAHQHGRTEEAVLASRMLDLVSNQLSVGEAKHEEEVLAN